MHEFRFRFVFNVSFGLVNPDFSRIPPIFLFKNPINLPFSWQKIPIFPFFFYQVASGHLVVIWQHQLQPSIFSMVLSLFHGSTVAIKGVSQGPHILFHNTYCSHQLQQALCDWFKKIWRVLCLFEESNCSPAFLKGVYLFHRTSCSNFRFKCIVLNTQKHLQRPHSFMVNVFIW